MKLTSNKIFSFMLAAVFALALAGCGGSGGGTAQEPDPPPMPDPQMVCEDDGGEWRNNACVTAAELMMERQTAQRGAIDTAIGTATTAVNAVNNDSTDAEVEAAETAISDARDAITAGADLPQAEKDANTGTVDALETQLAGAKSDRQTAKDDADKAMREMMAATGKLLYAALAGTTAGANDNALANIGAPVLAASGLTIDAAAGAGALADATDPDAVELKAGDDAAPLGGWSGTDYAHSAGTGASMVTNDARVYTNRGAPKSVTFARAGYTVATATTGDAIKDYVFLVDDGAVQTGFDIGDVMADVFTHSGTQTHTYDAVNDAAFTTRGTYDGAPGEYRCTGTCSSTNDGKGSPSALTGDWHFKPDSGAMVSQPDGNYLYFGWWVSKNSDGEPTAASAFAGEVGDVDGTGDTASGADLTGSATYVGHAVGKFATRNMLDGSNNGGHFTADATLTAKFGAIAADNDNGVTGTIDNFRLNDGDEDPGWSVSLNRSSAWAADGAITGPTSDATVWSINGVKAAASGGWSGTMYDEMPGDPPDGDGSNIPTTVTGTFYSEFSDRGRMVGAFGADKE